MNASRVLAAYASDIRFELIKMIRTPAFAVPTLAFPVMFYLLFGVLLGKNDPAGALQTFARLGVFGTMAPGLFGFGVSLAFEREYGTLIYKQALPMPHGSYLLARMVMAMLFASIIALLFIGIAFTAAHAPLTAGQAARVFVIEVLGVLPFCAVGLMVGALSSGQAAPALVNLIYLPMSFLSGLWVPLQFLPRIIQELAPIWPSFHLAQLVLAALGKDSTGSAASHVAALAGMTILCFTIAMRRLSNSGLRLLGGSARAGSPRIARFGAAAAIWVGIALVIFGAMGAKTKVVAAPAESAEASGSAATDPDAAGGPVGVAIPADPLIADFDAGSAQARYGAGWFAAGDDMRGGSSKATQRVIGGGAAGSTNALEVSGSIGDAIQYPFAGTAFFPVSADAGRIADYRGRTELRFFARGDGRQYTVLFLGLAVDTIPPMYGFTAGPDWQEVRVPLGNLSNLDLARVHGIVIGTNGPVGDFRFEIDGIELR